MIKIQIDEYGNLTNELSLLHTDSIQFINEYITDLNSILVKNGGFYADLISEKIDIILGMFRENMVPELINIFENTEEKIQIFAEGLAETDESGGIKIQWEE